jgi:hypothetical protein
MAPDGRVAYAARCTVPYSEAALRRVDRHFGMERGGGADQFAVREGMLTTQTCVEDESTGKCLFDPLVVTAPPRDNVDPCESKPLECTLKRTDGPDDGWSDPNDPLAGGGGSSPDQEEEDGPGIFSACVIGLLGVAGASAILMPAIRDMYEKARAVDSAERMLRMVRENNATLETIARYEGELSNAKQAYNDSVLNVALAGGGTTMLIVTTVGLCAPTLIVPVP